MIDFKHLQSIEKNLNDMVKASIQQQINTAQPGSVVSFDGKTKTAQLGFPISDFRQLDNGEREEVDWENLGDVPIWYPGGGGWQMTWPLKKGDPVLVIFCQRDIKEWFFSDGVESVPAPSPETHRPSDAICIPRLFPGKNVGSEVTEHFTLEGFGTKMIFKTDGTVVIEGGRIELGAEGASQAIALASKQDLINTQFATRVDPMVAILTGGAFPAMTPVESVASKKVYAKE